jgi:DNA end-binding protein Ku
VLAAIDEKIAGKDIVVADPQAEPAGGQIIDLTEALRASLRKPAGKGAEKAMAPVAEAPKERKAAKRAGAAVEPAPVAEPARARARK